MAVSKRKWQFYRAIIVFSMVIFTETYSISFIQSYLPEMTIWLGFTEPDKGYYVGIVMSSYFAGAFCTIYPFCWMFDRLDQRRMVVALLVANAVFSCIFAISNNFIMVVIFHFLMGTCHALVHIAKAGTGKFSDDQTQTTAMTIILISFAMGQNAGMAVGGYLSSPASKYPEISTKLTFLVDYPYFVPPFIATVLSVITIVLVIFLYPTKHGNEIEEITIDSTDSMHIPMVSDCTVSEGAQYVNDANVGNVDASFRRVCHKKIETITSLDNPNSDHDIDVCLINTNQNTKHGRIRHYAGILSRSSFVKLLQNWDVMKCLITLSLVYSAGFAYFESFAVWASTDKSLGGLGYTTDSIGSVWTFIIIPCAVLQLIIGPACLRKLGATRTYIVLITIRSIAVTSVPLCRYFNDERTQWIVIVTLQALIYYCMIGVSIAVSMMINNSVPLNETGSANGLGGAIATLSKSVYSIITGYIFVESITSNVGAPIDASLVFVLIGGTFWVSAIFATFVPRKFDYKTTSS